MSFARALAFVQTVEGGNVDDPQDPGGVTSGGIAQQFHPGIDVTRLSAEQKAQIIHDQYWMPVRGDQLPDYLGAPVLAAAVLAGPVTAIRQLQSAAYVPVDGVLGPQTLSALHLADEHALVARFTALELVRLASLPGWAHDGVGWATRVTRAALEAFA